jgi:quercetin dioxygenase-like cupin family protein
VSTLPVKRWYYVKNKIVFDRSKTFDRWIPGAFYPYMTFSFVDVIAGKTLPEHSHVNEQVSIMLEGEFELMLDGKPVRFGPGEVVIIPSNTKHSGLAITDCKLLDVFYPVREDYRNR